MLQSWPTGNCVREEWREKWYGHTPENVVENEGIKILWDVNMQYDHDIEVRRSDIVIINMEDKNCFIINTTISRDTSISILNSPRW